ncbi:unnamed protein product [Paramecium pentaurelia]|uniref:Uncharacterized protein n=1 Tax=Paramecium pentaurelia TaxID=43138 RepID=A0A8S1X4V4_9CILI|nr:unnamed protein product [Paramecium pentaurelia]
MVIFNENITFSQTYFQQKSALNYLTNLKEKKPEIFSHQFDIYFEYYPSL